MTGAGPVVRFLGGESGHRGFFGGRVRSRSRFVVVGIVVAGGVVATPLAGWPALAGTVAAVAATVAVTARTHRGSVLERRRRRARWRSRQRLGTDRFEPFEADRWAVLEDAVASGRGRGREEAVRARAGMRAMPDGADGMGWLRSAPGVPGVAWHAPVGEESYLSVVFEVAGQIRGVESDEVLAAGGVAWGRFLADLAGPESLVGAVQPVTRVLPPDLARHEAWARGSADPAAPSVAVASYAEALRRAGRDAMVQRHYVAVSWPVSPRFVEAAAKFGAGRDGWRVLMDREIAAVARGLERAGLGGGRGRNGVVVLTARQTAALVLHQQDPSRPVDAARRVDPASLGVASRDEYAAHVVTGRDGREWWHRTAAVTAEGLSTGPRSQTWALGLLLGGQLDVVRSVSWHLRLVPALHARAAARRDLTADRSAAIATAEKGRLADDEVSAAAAAADRRVRDLAAGSHHHGVEWVGFVTVTAPGRGELRDACRRLAETCASGMGVERLEWLDSYQAAASGTTWPIGRGSRPARAGLSARAYDVLAGRGEKEERVPPSSCGVRRPWWAGVPGLGFLVPPVVEPAEPAGGAGGVGEVAPSGAAGAVVRVSSGLARRGWYAPVVAGAPSTTRQAEVLNLALVAAPTGAEGVVNGRDGLSRAVVAHDAPTAYNQVPREVTSPNVLYLGGVGGGKSAAVKTVGVARPLALRGRSVVVFDKKRNDADLGEGEYAPLARALGASPVRFAADGSGTRLNIMDPLVGSGSGARGQYELLCAVARVARDNAPLEGWERTALRAALACALAAAEGGRVPVAADLLPWLGAAADAPGFAGLRPAARDRLHEAGCSVRWTFEELLEAYPGLLDGETSRDVDLAHRLTVFDLSQLPDEGPAVPVVMAIGNMWLAGRLRRARGAGRTVTTVVYEEGWHMIGGPSAELVRSNQKLSRSLGISNVFVMHKGTDIPRDSPGFAVVQEAQTVYVFRQDRRDDAEWAVATFGLAPETADTLMDLPAGHCVAKIGARPEIRLEHVRSDWEIGISDTDAAMAVAATRP